MEMNIREDYKNKIDEIPTTSFNKDQKAIAKKLLDACDINDIENVYKLLIHRVKTGFVFDSAPATNNQSISLLKYNEKLSLNDLNNDQKPFDENGLTNDNLLVIGENYDALKNLLLVYRNKIDIIYIDPPYNTENENFIYKDKFSRTGWLNIMQERLYFAKELLSDEGIIFVSIDDNEQAYLKVLMDDIFGENNFIANLGVELTKTQGMKVSAAQNGSVVKGYEYVLMYSKINKNTLIKNTLYDEADTFYDKHYVHWIDNDKHEKLIDVMKKNIWIQTLFDKYEIKLSLSNIDNMCRISNEFRKWIIANSDKIFRTSNIFLEKVNSLELDYGQITTFEKYLLIKNKNGIIEQLQSLKNSLNFSNTFKPRLTRTSIRGTLWKEFYKDMMNVEKEGGIDFKNGKKPIRLIKQLIYWVSNNKNSIILDFFAGSGTTAQAVMELNEEDGGNRRFILVTNNEEVMINKKPTGKYIATDITYERLYRITKGIGTKGESDFEWIKKRKPYKTNNIKVFDIEYKPVTIHDDVQPIYEQFKNTFRMLDQNINIDDDSIINKLFSLHPYKKEDGDK